MSRHQSSRPVPAKRIFAALEHDRAEFMVAGRRYTLDAMLEANAEDAEFCGWARSAVVGDRFEAMHAEPVRCVSGAVS